MLFALIVAAPHRAACIEEWRGIYLWSVRAEAQPWPYRDCAPVTRGLTGVPTLGEAQPERTHNEYSYFSFSHYLVARARRDQQVCRHAPIMRRTNTSKHAWTIGNTQPAPRIWGHNCTFALRTTPSRHPSGRGHRRRSRRTAKGPLRCRRRGGRSCRRR